LSKEWQVITYEKISAVPNAKTLLENLDICLPFYVMSVPVALCVFRIEVNDVSAVETEKQRGEFVSQYMLRTCDWITFVFNVRVNLFAVPCGAMAAESNNFCSARGRREMRDITVETYSSEKGETRPLGLIPGSEGTDFAALSLAAVEGLHL
jgi:hypothetical protein